jgi:hypothetical protein
MRSPLNREHGKGAERPRSIALAGVVVLFIARL